MDEQALEAPGVEPVVEEAPVEQVDTTVDTSAEPGDQPQRTMEETMAEVYDNMNNDDAEADDGPLRDEQGRFASRDTDSPGDEPPVDEATGEVDRTAEDPGVEDPAAEQSVIPDRWSDAEKAEFAALPPEVQQTVARREADRDRAFQGRMRELSQAANSMQDLDHVLATARPQYQARGLSDAQAINYLLSAQQALDANPEAAIRQMAQNYGVNLNQAPGEAGDDPFVDPDVAALRNQVQELQGVLQQQQMHQQQHAHQVQEQQLAATGDEIEAFFGETAADGSLARPHVNQMDVGSFMNEVGFLRSQNPGASNQQILQGAYERTVWNDPNLRQGQIRQELTAAAAQQKAAAAKAQKTAGRPARNVSTRGVAPPASDKGRTMEETMSAVYDRMHPAA